jgi:hypothetical protein
MSDVIPGYLSDNVAVDQAIAATGAGTSTITSSEFDMLGYTSALIVCTFGTPAANNTITLQDSATSGGEASTTATTNDATKTPLVLDVQNVGGRYIKIQAARGTSTTIDQVTLVRYNARIRPTTQTSTVKLAQFNGV